MQFRWLLCFLVVLPAAQAGWFPQTQAPADPPATDAEEPHTLQQPIDTLSTALCGQMCGMESRRQLIPINLRSTYFYGEFAHLMVCRPWKPWRGRWSKAPALDVVLRVKTGDKQTRTIRFSSFPRERPERASKERNARVSQWIQLAGTSVDAQHLESYNNLLDRHHHWQASTLQNKYIRHEFLPQIPAVSSQSEVLELRCCDGNARVKVLCYHAYGEIPDAREFQDLEPGAVPEDVSAEIGYCYPRTRSWFGADRGLVCGDKYETLGEISVVNGLASLHSMDFPSRRPASPTWEEVPGADDVERETEPAFEQDASEKEEEIQADSGMEEVPRNDAQGDFIDEISTTTTDDATMEAKTETASTDQETKDE